MSDRSDDTEVHLKALERENAEIAQAKSDKLALWGGGLLGVVSAGAALSGVLRHDHVQLIAGMLFGMVAFKIIPFSEAAKFAVKLWPFGRNKGNDE